MKATSPRDADLTERIASDLPEFRVEVPPLARLRPRSNTIYISCGRTVMGGSVWPVENGTFALAFMRYGLHGHLEQLCRAQFDAAVLFDHSRLPLTAGPTERMVDALRILLPS